MIKEIIGFLAGVLTTFASLPQIIKCIKTRDTTLISGEFLFLITSGVFLWFIYGLILQDPIMTAFNFIAFVLWLTLSILKIKEIINNRNNKK